MLDLNIIERKSETEKKSEEREKKEEEGQEANGNKKGEMTSFGLAMDSIVRYGHTSLQFLFISYTKCVVDFMRNNIISVVFDSVE